MRNNSVEYVNNVMGHRFVEYHGVASSWELLLAQKSVIGNTLVKYDAHERHILGESTRKRLEEQLKNAIRLKHFSLRTEES